MVLEVVQFQKYVTETLEAYWVGSSSSCPQGSSINEASHRGLEACITFVLDAGASSPLKLLKMQSQCIIQRRTLQPVNLATFFFSILNLYFQNCKHIDAVGDCLDNDMYYQILRFPGQSQMVWKRTGGCLVPARQPTVQGRQRQC